MALARRPLMAGNWKMNGLIASRAELTAMIAGSSAIDAGVDLLVCPPVTILAEFASLAKGARIAIGAQDCHADKSGACTGEISAEMLQDAGATAVIVGHSERRTFRGEGDAQVAAKVAAARRAALMPIICVGETEAERTQGRTLDVIGGQLAGSVPDGDTGDRLVIAYEPVWAIGTGVTPTLQDVAAVHGFIRTRLVSRFGEAGDKVRILYGGSVKPDNAAALLATADVDGALVGGASLKARDFLAIAGAMHAE